MMQRPDPAQFAYVLFFQTTQANLTLHPLVEYPITGFTFDAVGQVCGAMVATGETVPVDTGNPDHPIYYAGVVESIGTIDAYNRQSCLNMIESLYGFKEAEYFVEEEVGPDSPLHLLRQLAIAQCLQDNRPSEVRYTDAKRRKLDSIAYKIMFGVT